MRFEITVTPNTIDDTTVYDAECHDTALDEPCFRSVGWATEEAATTRINEHLNEHATGTSTRELEAFRTNKTYEEYEAHVNELLVKNALPVQKEAAE